MELQKIIVYMNFPEKEVPVARENAKWAPTEPATPAATSQESFYL